MTKRITYFDWLRGAAAFAVVILHMLNMMLSTHPVSDFPLAMVVIWTQLQLVLTRWAVPAFFMVSGALLLDPTRDVSWDTIALYVARVAGALLVFCCVYSCVGANAITPSAIAAGLGKAFTRGSWDHLWYIYALIGLYLLTPILSAYVRATTPALQRTTLLVLSVPTLFVRSINAATGLGLVSVAWVTSSVFYYLLGAYVHQHVSLDRRIVAVGLGSLAAGLAGIVFLITFTGIYPNWFIKPECPLVTLWSLLVFAATKRFLDGRPVPRLLALASKHSLAIYLVHPIVLVVLYRRLLWMPYQTFPPVVFELVVTAITFGVTIPIAVLLKRLPGLRHIL